MSACTTAQTFSKLCVGQYWLIANAGFFLLTIYLIVCSANASANTQWLKEESLQTFAALYKEELGLVQKCNDNTTSEIAFCAGKLKNSGNAPRILLPKNTLSSASNTPPKATIVLFHGLGDSPYFVRSIANSFQQNNYLVITPLLPGHGKKVATQDMQDPTLREKWLAHVNEVMAYAESLGFPVYIGGFSAGGTFATWYGITHTEKVNGILLFSAALRLSSSAETMSRIWGIKTIARWLDGDYQANGAHPYKYPSIASFSALLLIDVMTDIREFLGDNKINLPIFAAHSLADNITMFSGVESLTQQVKGEHMLFKIDKEYDLCHQDLPMSSIQLIGLNFNRSLVNQRERCAVPKANPLHTQMMFMANLFVDQHLRAKSSPK